MTALTKRQRSILDYIEEYIETERIAPTYREIMHHFKFTSPGTVYKHIHTLKKKGVLDSEKNTPRSLTLEHTIALPEIRATVELPFIGYIRAGFPIETFPHMELITVPAPYVSKPDQSYILKVRGDALKEEQIAEDDLLIVEARSIANSGEMAIVLVNSHDTFLKKYYPEGPYVRLEGINPNVRPMILRKENLEIQGVLIAMLRTYKQHSTK
jgi:repressor LexA